MAVDFMKLAGGKPCLREEVRKGKPPIEFRLEGATWALISVYNVKDSKFPLQGAYIAEDDFCHGMRALDLLTLRSKHPTVKLSPMDDIRAWIEAYASD